MDFPEGQSGGAHTKGAINQGNNRSDGNFKVAPEDSIAPADREGLRDEEVRLHGYLDSATPMLTFLPGQL
jgi:hypothetical protein